MWENVLSLLLNEEHLFFVATQQLAKKSTYILSEAARRKNVLQFVSGVEEVLDSGPTRFLLPPIGLRESR